MTNTAAAANTVTAALGYSLTSLPTHIPTCVTLLERLQGTQPAHGSPANLSLSPQVQFNEIWGSSSLSPMSPFFSAAPQVLFSLRLCLSTALAPSSASQPLAFLTHP